MPSLSKNIDNNEIKEILLKLESLGLAHKEALVYISLLQLGEVGSSKIISYSGLHGQFVYQCLKDLEEKGLVQHANIRGRNKYSAKSPTTLSLLIEQKKKIADEVNERLQRMIVIPDKQPFEIFQGKESFVTQEFNLLNNAKEGSTLLVIGGTGDKWATTLEKQLGEYEYIRNKKNITVQYIGSENQRSNLSQSEDTRTNFQYRLLPGLFTGEVNTNIWSDTVALNIFSDPVTNFTISNIQIAESYKQFFETLWKIAK